MTLIAEFREYNRHPIDRQLRVHDHAEGDSVKPVITRLDSTTAASLLRLMPSVWAEDWGADILRETFRWRYFDRPSGGETRLMMDQDQCIAMLDSYLRPYLLDLRRIVVREGADWFCLPKYRPLGLGLKLMRMMMALPEPMIAIGGTDATVSLLPLLGWKPLPAVQNMILPITLRGLVSTLLRRWWPRHVKRAAAIPRFIPVHLPRRMPPPAPDAEVIEWRPGDKLDMPVPQRNGLIALLDPTDLEWFYAGPRELFRPMVLLFRVGGEPVGISLSQLEPSALGPEGRIVHLQLAGREQPVTNWVVSETVRRLSQAGAGSIQCRASNPLTITALRKTGFIAARSQPAFWWAKNDVPPPSGMDVGYLRADDALPFGVIRTPKSP
jgi:hypothetical protein